MKRSLLDDPLDVACAAIERSTHCFDGHRQLPLRSVPWDGSVGFDPDEIEHEQTLNTRPGRKFLSIQEIAECDCEVGACMCHTADPREALEATEEEEALQAACIGDRSPLQLARELGEMFRLRLKLHGVAC